MPPRAMGHNGHSRTERSQTQIAVVVGGVVVMMETKLPRSCCQDIQLGRRAFPLTHLLHDPLIQGTLRGRPSRIHGRTDGDNAGALRMFSSIIIFSGRVPLSRALEIASGYPRTSRDGGREDRNYARAEITITCTRGSTSRRPPLHPVSR